MIAFSRPSLFATTVQEGFHVVDRLYVDFLDRVGLEIHEMTLLTIKTENDC